MGRVDPPEKNGECLTLLFSQKNRLNVKTAGQHSFAGLGMCLALFLNFW